MTMLTQRLVLAWMFRLSGLAIAIPSLAILADVGFAYLTAGNVPATQPERLEGRNYGLIGLLVIGARGMAAMLGAFIKLVTVAAEAVIVLTCITTLFGVLLFFTGGGIDKGAGWARIVAMVLCALLLLLSGGLLSTQDARFVGVAGCAIFLWSLYVLSVRYH